MFLLKVFERGVTFYGRYTKGLPFLSKMVHKRVRAWMSAGVSLNTHTLDEENGENLKIVQTKSCQLVPQKAGQVKKRLRLPDRQFKKSLGNNYWFR